MDLSILQRELILLDFWQLQQTLLCDCTPLWVVRWVASEHILRLANAGQAGAASETPQCLIQAVCQLQHSSIARGKLLIYFSLIC